MGRKKGPIPNRIPTVSSVSKVAEVGSRDIDARDFGLLPARGGGEPERGGKECCVELSHLRVCEWIAHLRRLSVYVKIEDTVQARRRWFVKNRVDWKPLRAT